MKFLKAGILKIIGHRAVHNLKKKENAYQMHV
jgi:hypothetical protein